jgi:ferredoxin
MADKTQKTEDNVPGPYYVDTSCIMCGLCYSVAPDNFEEAAPYARVKKQPVGQEEEDLCREAKDNCPVNAIGDDGE